MSPTATPSAPAQSHDAKRSAALFSVLAAAGVTLLKLITGLLTGSLGMLSEAAHSGIDVIAAAITFFSVQVADRPADADHSYGHGKVESLSAGIETVLMLGSAIWIVTESIRRILFREHLALTFSIWPFVVLLLSILVDLTRSSRLHAVARAYNSDALEADALHFRTDIWSSTAVFLGLAATYIGKHWYIPALELADPIAAIIVAIVILQVTWRLARRTVDALTDATPAETRGLIRDLAAIDGVLSVNRVRTRRSGPSYFADVTLGIPRNVTFQRSEQITQAATAAVQRHLPGADVVVHSVPTASRAESVHDRIRAVAARSNLAIHDVSVQEYNHHLHVEQHLEVPETMSLLNAHNLVTQLESEMRRDIPELATILTHIESEPATIERPESLEPDRQLEVRLRRAAQAFPEVLDIHEVFVTRTRSNSAERIQVSCHCTLPDNLPMAEVHAIITALENTFKQDCPEVTRLFIHPEPATDNRR